MTKCVYAFEYLGYDKVVEFQKTGYVSWSSPIETRILWNVNTISR